MFLPPSQEVILATLTCLYACTHVGPVYEELGEKESHCLAFAV